MISSYALLSGGLLQVSSKGKRERFWRDCVNARLRREHHWSAMYTIEMNIHREGCSFYINNEMSISGENKIYNSLNCHTQKNNTFIRISL